MLDDRDLPPQLPAAYPIPWHVDRRDRLHPVVTHTGDAVDFVRLFADDRHGTGRTQLWGHVRDGDQMELCLCDAPIDDLVVTIAWFRIGDGLEYLWRFVV